MENILKLKKEFEEQTQAIQKRLDKTTQNKKTNTLIKEYRQIITKFNNYSPSKRHHTQKTAFLNYNNYETKLFYYQDKLKDKLIFEIEEETKKALDQLYKIDELFTILQNNKLIYNKEEQQQTQRNANKIYNIILLLEELTKE